MSRITSLFCSVWSSIKDNPRKSIAAVVALLVVLVLANSSNGVAPEEQDDLRTPNVEVASVLELSNNSEPLRVLGEVRSVSQAELRVQKPGEITRVYVQAGQYVGAGALLAEVTNAGERATVLSAQGALAAAEAQLAKVQAGDRSEDRASVAAQTQSAVVSLQSAQDGARAAYSQAYTLAQDAIVAQADDFFDDVYTVNPRFRVRTASYDEKQIIETERRAIGELLDAWKTVTLNDIPNTELDVRLQEAQSTLERIKIYLNNISTFVSEQEPDSELSAAEKATQEGVVLGARSSIDAARSAVNGSRTALAGALSGAQVASLAESKTTTGARPEDVKAAQAAVTQAQGALNGAYAQLENTIARTPIAGTVSTFNVARGDFVGTQEVVAVVANPSALEIEVFVSDTARERITVGMPVRIDEQYEGVVTTVAPGLDPATKKARVTVGVSEGATLVNGAYVDLAFQAAQTEVTDQEEFMIPIAAIKVLPRGLAVLVVNDQSELEARTITEGPIVGNKMIVREGLTADMRIVRDARGLKEGDTVATGDVPLNTTEITL